MRCLCFVLLLIALFVVVSSKVCKDNCTYEYDPHCATYLNCYYHAINFCEAHLKSCYRESIGLSGLTEIRKGNCNFGMPRCSYVG